MRWIVAKSKHMGGRKEQQDNVETFFSPEKDIHLLVLADGMGGHKGGVLASRAVVDVARQVWNNSRKAKAAQEPQTLLRQICEQAHQRINDLGRQHKCANRGQKNIEFAFLELCRIKHCCRIACGLGRLEFPV
ncbi:MAG: hypothetical protein GY862_35340 [Gammaproteobacteria bacterium]|nr:hypothetical protein [Gammaproteobacteria bacterium]